MSAVQDDNGTTITINHGDQVSSENVKESNNETVLSQITGKSASYLEPDSIVNIRSATSISTVDHPTISGVKGSSGPMAMTMPVSSDPVTSSASLSPEVKPSSQPISLQPLNAVSSEFPSSSTYKIDSGAISINEEMPKNLGGQADAPPSDPVDSLMAESPSTKQKIATFFKRSV
jgi:hypothetical protein